MRFYSLLLLFMATSLFAQDKVSFSNDREGESYYLKSSSTKRSVGRALKSVDGATIVASFREVLGAAPANKLCAYDLNEVFLNRLKDFDPKFGDLPGALHHLRSQNEIDDVVVKILLDAHAVSNTDLPGKTEKEMLGALPKDREKLKQLLELVAGIGTKLSGGCYDEVYKNFYGEVRKIDKEIKSYQLEALYYHAQKSKLIDSKTFHLLERARKNELEGSSLSLKAYHQKLKSLRIHFPLRDAEEKSNFATAEFEKGKMSRRQRLLESYTDLQIIIMGNVIKKLRERLDSPKIEILVYDHESLQETIPLEPMERFRFAIKLLRKEMIHLSLNTYFDGRTPDYMDLMTASYELGIIPASELDEIVSLKEIWSPTKTFWEKSMVWIRVFSSVAALVIPPPYGFIPALAVVVIEATVVKKKKNTNTEDPTSLF